MNPSTLIGAALLLVAGAAVGAGTGTDSLQAVRVGGNGPIIDPASPAWGKAKPFAVTMLPQVVTTPTHPEHSVKQMQVRAAHNGQWLAFLIEWPDATRSDRLVVDQFGDQVAVELPIAFKKDALPNPMMGNPGGRVNVLQWRAAFQHDIDHGEPEIRTLYPNAVIDLYPDQVLRATDARPYMGAIGVDNPISRAKDSPVLDQMAEGWGTLTVKLDQHADGKGVWRDGKWRVVITLPMATESLDSPRLAPGGETAAAFAVWDGEGREVGSRKAWSMWVPVRLLK